MNENITLVICPTCGAWKLHIIKDATERRGIITFRFDRRSVCSCKEPVIFVSPVDKLQLKVITND